MFGGIQELEKCVQTTQALVHKLAQRLDGEEPRIAMTALEGTLRGLRRQLDVQQVADFASHLPLPLMGAFYEGWRPSAPEPAASLREFLARIERAELRDTGVTVKRGVKAAMEVIAGHTPAPAMAAVAGSLPDDFATLWPDEPPPYPDPRGTQVIPPEPDEVHRSRTSPSRLRRATRGAPGETVKNALPERRGRAKKARR